MQKRRKPFLPILVLVIIGAAAVAWFALSGKQEQIDYLTETVRIGDIRKTVNATGEVGAVQLVSVGAQASGQIEKLYVELGQQVKKGDPIVDIDSTTQRNDLETAKAKLETYQAQLASKQVALKVAQTQYNREAQLRKTNSTSRENQETAENTLAAAKAAVAELESQIRQAQIAVNTAETNLGYTKISAPLDGTVVAVPVEEGQTVNANQTTPTIVQIADLSRMEIKIEIAEGDITLVKPGMAVEYTILSDPGTARHAVLDSIDPGLTTLSDGTYEKTSTSSSSSSNAVYYYANAKVNNDDGSLRIGMTTQNVIDVAGVKQVPLVPSIAIESRPNGESYVNVLLPGNKVEERTITTGVSDNMHTEVLSGLQVGDEVISTQMSRAEAAAQTGGMRGPRR